MSKETILLIRVVSAIGLLEHGQDTEEEDMIEMEKFLTKAYKNPRSLLDEMG